MARRCTYTGASVFDRRQRYCKATAGLDGLVSARLGDRTTEPKIKRSGLWSVNACPADHPGRFSVSALPLILEVVDKEKRGEETVHSRILRCLTQLGHERIRRCPATPDAWKKAMSASRARQKDKLSLVFLVSLLVLRCFFVQLTWR